MASEGKKPRLEMKGKERILFIEVDGDLLGIDLKKYDYSNLQSESIPVPAPICCRLELRKHKYPHGMRHIKINDKLYLLGGQCFDFDPNSSARYLGYSDKVYEFNLHTLTTQINDNDNDEPLFLHPDRVLRPLHPLLRPKFALVANLRDRFYALHDRVPTTNVSFRKPQDPFCTFEEFDPINESRLPAPVPLFYQSTRKADFNKEEEEEEEEEETPEMAWPCQVFPVSCHFVVDDKWLLFCHLQGLVHIFTRGDNEWKADPDKYASISDSFHRICHQSVPDTGLWLSNFNFGYDDAKLGVMISIQLVEQYDCYDINIPYVYKYVALGYAFHQIYKVYAYAINKSTCHVEFYQPLDEVFSDMIRTPLNTEKCVTKYLMDLGESEHNNNRSRRICAILTGDDLMNHIPYLYISIFELQMTQAPSLDPCFKFLHLITPIKKLIFRLDKDENSLANAYNNNSFLFKAYNIPPLDAFVI